MLKNPLNLFKIITNRSLKLTNCKIHIFLVYISLNKLTFQRLVKKIEETGFGSKKMTEQELDVALKKF